MPCQSQEKEQIQSDLRKLGNIKSIHLIQKVKVDDLFIYSYIIVFDKARILMDFTFDEDFIAYKMETKRVYISNMDIFRQSGSARDNLWIQIGLLIIGVAIVFMIIYMFIARKKKIALLANDNS